MTLSILGMILSLKLKKTILFRLLVCSVILILKRKTWAIWKLPNRMEIQKLKRPHIAQKLIKNVKLKPFLKLQMPKNTIFQILIFWPNEIPLKKLVKTQRHPNKFPEIKSQTKDKKYKMTLNQILYSQKC